MPKIRRKKHRGQKRVAHKLIERKTELGKLDLTPHNASRRQAGLEIVYK